jgi:hypothetical protein
LVAEPREAIAGGRLFADDAPLRHRDDG